MFKRSAISAAALVTIGAITAGPAFAQEVQEKLERVEVTGSRLKTIGNTSSSPITSVGKEDINTTQPVAVEELVRGLPSSYPAIGPAMNNGSTGIASIDLRGLGSNRTLVLFNGKRFVPANLGGVVDTNNVPVSLLERVDLVTGGASAVYGADAVSGVVNFVTKRNFTGIEATTLYSISEKGDAGRRKNDITMGANLADGRGNVALHIGTTKTDPLRLADRDYSQVVISSATGNPGGFSGTAAPAQFSGMPAPINGGRVIDATTGLLRAVGGTEDAYNTNPPNYFETPLTRTQATALGHFRINDNAEAYAELFHTRSNVTLNLAPSGTFGAAFNVPIGNPFITDKVRTQLCAAYAIAAADCVAGGTKEVRMNIARRFVEAGPRIYSYDNTTTQYTVGLRGDIPMLDSWSYDTYYQSGRSDQTQRTGNGFSSTKTQQALRATNANGCTVTTGGCVPLNVFGAAGSITPAMLAFISTPTFQTTRVEQQVTSLAANGEVAFAKSPWARAPLGLALGMEKRTVFGANASDAVVQTQGELLGSGAPTPDRSGKLNFTETYMEANLPLLQNLPLVQSLNLGAGYRETKLSTSTGESQSYGSWKGGLDWTPMKGLRFRGERQRATRAPNINELYAPVTTGLATLAVDPCQGNKIAGADAGKAGTLTNLCQLTGVPVAQIGSVAAPSSSQINNTGGGNPSLGPEKANTTTLGVVWEPAFVDNLSLNLDYWRIKISDGVSSATAGQVINGCYDATLNPGLTNNVFCQAIQRDPLNGGLNGTGSKGVVTQSSNLGAYDFSGVDIGGSYRLNLKSLGAPKMGRIDFTLQLSLLNKADFKSLPSVATLEQAGYYGTDVGTPYAKTRFSQRATWTFGDYSLGYNWRYIGESEIQQDKVAANKAEYTKLKAVSYIDLNGSWQAMKNVKLSLTVNNLFDKQPPFTATGVGPGSANFGNTFPGVYDVIGRRFTFSAQAAF
ncbi:TonB-dependent receptor [Paucibacter sp. DJ1R-11]|uniref:TonB-dependent receptor domain-containing protein n=1 Tax=Paucibacter sp. DJ1R-11 TaxID=2893556 RepID=UPI0021E36671|nr:TonB-dependent receptor [Paucibacter sp. DJ1R-11]MCV2362346.1 TonB-dependent receptor [Paucibacter sp. DJ1R-11]